MSKVTSVATLVRDASRGEQEFVEKLCEILEEGDPDRVKDFFDRMNIPRTQGGEGLLGPLPDPIERASRANLGTFEAERQIAEGIRRFLDRHERKIKYHRDHPELDSTENVLLLFRHAMIVTQVRLRRLRQLLKSKDELNPREWQIARDQMNTSYLSFRTFLQLVTVDWLEAVIAANSRDELMPRMQGFYERVDEQLRFLEETREHLEDRRLELSVHPEGYPPVKPPSYFGGDLMGIGPWKQYWQRVSDLAHRFRESIG